MNVPSDPSQESDVIPFPGPGGIALEEDPEITVAPQQVSVTQWLEFWRYLDGRPIRFEDQPWIKPMLDCTDPWQVWQTGRQVAKSTSLASQMVAFGCNIQYLRQLYVTPTFKQTTVFSKDRLRPAIYDSPPIVELYVDRECTDNVFTRGLATPSQMLMRHCFLNADSARGASAHVLLLDEIQDLHKDVVPVVEETTSAARRNRELTSQGFADVRRYCGTPKSFDSMLEEYWKRSTQNEWIVPCRGCGKENMLDEDNIGPKFLICKACGHDLDWGEGRWMTTDPSARWTGWHVSQLMAAQRDENDPQGWIPWDDILEKQRTYTPKTFYNEVLGVAFDSGMRPITKAQIMACCQPEYSLNDVNIGVHECFGGLDWAMESESYSSYTVFTIWTIVNMRFQLQYVKKFTGREAADPDFILREVMEKMNLFNCVNIGCDWGVGHMENVRLINNLGPDAHMRVMEFQHVMQSDEIKYDEKRRCWLLDKPRRMERFLEAMKQKWVWFPKWAEFDEYHMDIYTIYNEYNEHFRRQVYYHKEPDDFFQSALYAWEAMNYYYQYKVRFGKPTIVGVD